MIYEVAAVEDLGNRYRVKYVANHDGRFVKEGSEFLNLSNVAADEVKKNLSEGNIVLIPKGLTNEVSVMDLVIEVPDELEVEKSIAIIAEQKRFDYRLATITALEVANFMLSNNKLMSHGIYVTDENRDEVYLDIISSGDESKINLLSEYLESMDRISSVTTCMRMLSTFTRDINKAKSKEEIQDIIKSHRQRDY